MATNWTPEQLEVLTLLQEGMRRIYGDEDAALVLDWLHSQSGKPPNTAEDVLRFGESFAFYDAELEKRAARSLLPPDERRVFTFPWKNWSTRIDTPDEGMLILVGAKPGAGKTILAEMIGEHNASQGLRGALFNFELNKVVMLDRRAVRHIREPRWMFKRGVLTPHQLEQLAEFTPPWMNPDDRKGLGDWQLLSRRLRDALNEANARMKAWVGGLDYWSTPGWDVDRLVATARAEHAANPLGFLIVDYLEKIQPSARQRKIYGVNFTEREADTVEQLKILAEQLKIPIVMLSQLNKAGRAKDASDFDGTEIKGSGAKTERSNIVVLISVDKLPEAEDGAEPPDPALGAGVPLTVAIAKNTMGGEGVFKMFRDGARFTIHDLFVERTNLNTGAKTTI